MQGAGAGARLLGYGGEDSIVDGALAQALPACTESFSLFCSKIHGCPLPGCLRLLSIEAFAPLWLGQVQGLGQGVLYSQAGQS